MRLTKEMVEAVGKKWEIADAINQAMDTLESQRLPRLDVVGDLQRSKIAFKYATIRQSFTYRLVDLGNSTLDELLAGNTLASIVLVRSFFETVAVVHSISRSANGFLESRDTTALDRFAMRVLFGARTDYWKIGDHDNAIQVMSALDHLTKELPEARERYERISEISHPNSQGTFQFYGKTEEGELVVEFSRDKRGPTQILAHVMTFMMGAPWAVRKMAELDEMIPRIADLQDPPR
jgi:hypothetical protein